MSISADPKATVEFDVQTVAGLTIPLTARFLTWRERKALNDLIDSKLIGKSWEDPEVTEAAEQAIRMGITTPFEKLEPLTLRELVNLAIDYRVVIDLTEIERGKFSSLLPSIAGTSAAPAKGDAATSPTKQAH